MIYIQKSYVNSQEALAALFTSPCTIISDEFNEEEQDTYDNKPGPVIGSVEFIENNFYSAKPLQINERLRSVSFAMSEEDFRYAYDALGSFPDSVWFKPDGSLKWPIWLKPTNRYKAFPATYIEKGTPGDFIFKNYKDFNAQLHYDNMIAEYRLLISYEEQGAIAVHQYGEHPDFELSLNRTELRGYWSPMARCYHPFAYTVDIAVLDTDYGGVEYRALEAHHPYAVGWYGKNPSESITYINWLTEGFERRFNWAQWMRPLKEK